MDDPTASHAVEVYEATPVEVARRPHGRRAHRVEHASTAIGHTAKLTGRAMYRHRVILLPYYAFAGLLFAATLHHLVAGDQAAAQAMSVYGPGLAVAVAAVGVALKLPRAADGSGPASGAMIAGAGLLASAALGWLWLTVATGPGLGLIIVGLLLTTFGALPYWKLVYNTRHPQQTVVNLPASMVPAAQAAQPDPGPFASISDMAGSEWLGPRAPTESGWSGELQLPAGKSAREIAEKRRGQVAAVLQVGLDDIELTPHRNANDKITVHVHTRDLLAQPHQWPLAHEPVIDFLAGFPIMVTRSGHTMELRMRERHFMVAGESGSGKSNVQAMVTGAAGLDPRVDLHLLDGKRTELAAWRDRAAAYADNDIDAAVDVLGMIQQRMDDTGDRMRDERRTQFDPDVDGIAVLDIDELPVYLIGGTSASDEFGTRLLDIGQRGRALGVIIVVAIQRASSRMFGKWEGDLRAILTYRMCMRLADHRASSMVLGGKWDGVEPHRLDQSRRGLAYLNDDDDGGRPRLGRTFLLPDADRRNIMETAAAIGPRPSVLTPPPAGQTVVEPVHTSHRVTALPVPRFPNGDPITDDRERDLWAALDDTEPRTVRDLIGHGYDSRQGTSDALDRLARAGHLHEVSTPRGRGYRRAVVQPLTEADAR